MTFTHKTLVNICIVYEINLWPYTQSSDFILSNSLCGPGKVTKSVDPMSIRILDARGSFSLSDDSGLV